MHAFDIDSGIAAASCHAAVVRATAPRLRCSDGDGARMSAPGRVIERGS